MYSEYLLRLINNSSYCELSTSYIDNNGNFNYIFDTDVSH